MHDEFMAWVWAVPLVLVLGLGIGIAKSCEDPPPCSDYSYKISRLPFNKKTAICDRWPGMTMEVEKGLLSGTQVNCTCPEE